VTSVTDLEASLVDLISRDAVKIPPYPSVALRLQRLASGGKFGLADMARIAGEDQALAALLLRHASSGVYRGVTATTSLHEAIGRVGAVEVCRIALAVGVSQAALGQGPLAELRRRAWRESIMAGLCAQRVAEQRGLAAEEGFVCGLLHRFGRLLAVTCLEEILVRRRDGRSLPAEEWERLVGRFEEELGMVTAARWNLSPLLKVVISSYRHPELAGAFRPTLEVVLLADAIAALVENRSSVRAADLGTLPGLRPSELGLVVQLVMQLPAVVAGLEEVASPPPPASPSPSQVTPPPSGLDGAPRDASGVTVHIVRATGVSACRGRHLTPAGVSFEGAARVQDNTLVRLRVERPPAPPGADVWAKVVLCKGPLTAQEVEAKLFGADRATVEAWNEIYQALPAS